MSLITDLGKQGPHPDVIPALVRQHADGDIQIIQQATLFDVKWSQWSKDDRTTKASGTLDLSASVAICSPKQGPKQRVGYAAIRRPDRDTWSIAQTSTGPIGNRFVQPLTACFLSRHGAWAGIGGLSHWPRYLGSVRITLADGQTYESTVCDRSFLVLAPCDAPELWSSPMTVEYYNTRGRTIRTDPYDLSRP